jgi:two-component sensor histidine kinase/integral membrane sensor domain MASE1
MSSMRGLDHAARNRLLIYVVLPVSYVIAGRLELLRAVPPGYATPIFLPAGIAVAATFLAGATTLPGIFVGSLLLNVWVGYSRVRHLDAIESIAAFAIASASALQAAVGGGVLRRFVGNPATFDAPRQLVAYLMATPLICVTSATFSVYSLWVLGIVQSVGLLSNWLDWWAGDSLGVLIALPLMLVFFGEPRPLWQYRRARVAVPIVSIFAIFVAIFSMFPSLSVITIGGIGTVLLGAFLLLITGQAFQLAATQTRIVADLHAMTRLHDIGTQCARDTNGIERCLQLILDAAIEITSADKGNIQLLNVDSGALTIAVQSGFDDRFLAFFAKVQNDSASACAAALNSLERVVVEDVAHSPLFAGTPALEVMLEAGASACQSTPLVSKGRVLGVLSTHFGRPHRLDDRVLRLLDLLARQAADYLERKRADATASTLVLEIQHRSNNLLSVIQAIANRSLSDDNSPTEARATFQARLQALARANRQLIKSNWTPISLGEIVRSELEPYGGRTKAEGSHISLSPKQAQDFSLALHELATNAAKYGALSNESGTVEIFWTTSTRGESAVLKFNWRERGGPLVTMSRPIGFGTALISAAFPNSHIDYATEGLRCEINLRLDGTSKSE